MSSETQYADLLRAISSPEKIQATNAKAFQIIVKKDRLAPGATHAFEATIAADVMAVDGAMSSHFVAQLKDFARDADTIVGLLENGVTHELTSGRPEHIRNEVTARIAQLQPEADQLRSDRDETARDLHNFKQAHGLTHRASTPDTKEGLYFLVAAAILEALGNWYFLSGWSSIEIALITAVVVAVTNVGVNVFFGIRYRDKNHSDSAIAAAGKRYLGYSIALIVILNVGISAFRIVGIADAQTLTAAVWLEGVALLILGVVLGAYAFNKGYKLDDPFPEHGEFTRRAERAAEAWRVFVERHADYCQDQQRIAVDLHTRLQQKILGSVGHLNQTLPAMRATLKQWELDRAQLGAAYVSLQKAFKNPLIMNHPEGGQYPREEVKLGDSPVFQIYADHARQFEENREETKAKIDALINEIRASLNELQEWIQSDEAKRLWQWPA